LKLVWGNFWLFQNISQGVEPFHQLHILLRYYLFKLC
jgi:hypothetical protein